MRVGMAVLLMAGLLAAGPAGAKDDADHDWARRAVQEGRMLPLRDILARAEADQPGRVVAAELEGERGVPVYEIKIVTDGGRLVKLHYDARSGALLKSTARGEGPR